MADYYHFPIYAKEAKEIPDWMKATQRWQDAVHVDKLQKQQLKVKMCCAKCEEKVVEEIREVRGVFDVRAERFNSKVVVVFMPGSDGFKDYEVLRRARKTDKKAKFVELDNKEKPKTEEQKKKEAEEAKKKKETEVMKKKKEEAMKEEHEAALSNVFTWNPNMVPQQWGGPYYSPPLQPEAYYPRQFFHREFTTRQNEEEEKKKKETAEKKKKEEEKKKKEKEADEKKKKQQEAAVPIPGFMWNPHGAHWGGPYYAPYPYYPEELGESRPSQWYAPRYHYPPLPFQHERDEFSQPYFYYH